MKVLSGNISIDSLLETNTTTSPVISWDTANQLGQPVNLTYNFLAAGTNSVTGFQAMNADLQAATLLALQNFSNVANITFTVGAVGASNLNLGTANFGGSQAAFTAGLAYNMLGFRLSHTWFTESNVYITNAAFAGYSTAPLGSSAYETLLHEIGHGLGLSHPFEGIQPPAGQDSTQFTVMSYTNGYAGSGGLFASTLMLNDISTIQYLYGANTNYNSGNNTYDLQAFLANGPATMWDGGGTDTISLAAFGANGQNLNLTSGVFSSINGVTNNFTIAYNANIENVIGSAGNDTITGNAVSNSLNGGAGNDTINGGAGQDTMVGGAGDDWYYVDDQFDIVVETVGGVKNDIVYTSAPFQLVAGTQRLIAEAGAAGAVGLTALNFYNNIVIGNEHTNVLIDQFGRDTYIGGGGADFFRFIANLDGVNNVNRVNDFNAAEDQFQLLQLIYSAIPTGILDASQFVNGTAALDANDRIIYDQSGVDGVVYYDPDGTGAQQQIEIVNLAGNPTITADDFQIY